MLIARIIRKLMCYRMNYYPLFGGFHRKKTIYLTFDDGPHPIHSNNIMDILLKYNIKATFFAVGANIEKHPEIAKRIVAEGHVLGNHTYSHGKLPSIILADRIKEIEMCQILIDRINASKSRYFRPPQGLASLSEYVYLSKNNYNIILWTIDSKDHSNACNKNAKLEKLANHNNVILYHDDSSNCIEQLNKLIPVWVANGYNFSVFH